MGMEPDDFYATFVLDNFHDFEQDQGSVRKAFNAATAAFQLADHVFAFYTKRAPAFRDEFRSKTDYLKYLTAKCPDFIHVQSVATVYKHLYADGPIYTVASGGSLEAVNDMDVIFQLDESKTLPGQSEDVGIEVQYETDKDNNFQSYVVIKTRTAGRLPFLPLLDNVVSMWSDELSLRWQNRS